MAKRGRGAGYTVSTKWSPQLAYAVGLVATDGSLSKDRRHIDFTSKDRVQVVNLKRCLGLTVKIGKKKSGAGNVSYRIQFGDVNFYRFLLSIGLSSNKSLTLEQVDVPVELFPHFLRGCFDGDGSIYSYWDRRYRSSFLFYVSFASGSQKFISWLRSNARQHLNVNGSITRALGKSTCYQLKYAKNEAFSVLFSMYQNADGLYLKRKYLKIKEIFGIVANECGGDIPAL